MMKNLLIALALLWSSPVLANVPCSVPFNLQNGTTADASQVMANYNAILTCLGNAAAAGANSDITSLNGLTTPITPIQGGSTIFAGGTSGGSGNAQTISTTVPTNFILTKGYTVVFVAGFTNSGATTLAVGGTAATNVFKQSTAGPIALTGGEIVVNQVVVATYDGTEFQINPVPVVAAGWGLAQNASATAIQINTTNPPYGFDSCVNAQINASVGSSIMTVALKAADTGGDPSSTHPVLCPFRDPTIANGGAQWLAITSALSINTNATGATLGSTNGNPFRFWVEIFNNAGTPVMGLFNASIPTSQVFSLDEATPQSTTAISAAATSAGIFYTPNGTTLSTKSFRIVGYLEYASGLTTAGTYASAPTKVQLFGPGIKKPGDVVQFKFVTDATQTQLPNTPFTSTGLTASITPSSTINPILVHSDLNVGCGTGVGTLQLGRNSNANLFGSKLIVAATGTQSFGGSTAALDFPATTSSTTYTVYGISVNTNTCEYNFEAGSISNLLIQEIMG